MGEGTNRVDNAPDPDELSEKVEKSRDRLDALAAELDQRRHILTRLKQAMRDKPAWVLGGGAAIAGILATAIALVVHRQRHQRRLVVRAQNLMQAFQRMMRKPDRVAAQDPDAAGKIMSSAASTAASTLVKRGIESLLRDRR
jgi:hypothetical protein